MIQRSIYIGTNGNATGKRMVALGMMELAARRFGRVAFFRQSFVSALTRTKASA
ncbi:MULTISPECIES: hypothetical protein [Rhodopirellula]|uniref:hypothetical protein n=1 Tax=Rhodopirellula TaxID=265488 RepID=UPI00257CE7F4|nr:hypothetical protein [Rhodopirellula sp. UBA1907]